MVGLEEGLAERGRGHRLLALRHVGQRIAGKVNPAPLPCGPQHARDRRLQALVGVGDDELDAVQAAPDEALEATTTDSQIQVMNPTPAPSEP